MPIRRSAELWSHQTCVQNLFLNCSSSYPAITPVPRCRFCNCRLRGVLQGAAKLSRSAALWRFHRVSFTLQIILLSMLSMPNFCQLFDRSPNISRTQHISSYVMRCNRFIPLKDNRITGNFEVTIGARAFQKEGKGQGPIIGGESTHCRADRGHFVVHGVDTCTSVGVDGGWS